MAVYPSSAFTTSRLVNASRTRERQGGKQHCKGMAGLVIDLCTPPPSPQRDSSGGGGCIDLCTPPSSPTAHGAPAVAAPAVVAPAGSKRPLSSLSTAPVKVKAQRLEVGPSSSADAGPSPMDDEVLETAAPPAPKKDVEMGGEDDENEDVQCTGRTGDNALMDFPHARENCCVVKFVQGQVPRTRIGPDCTAMRPRTALPPTVPLAPWVRRSMNVTPLFACPRPASPAGA